MLCLFLPLLQPPPTTQPRRGHDSHQEPPRHQAVHLTRHQANFASCGRYMEAMDKNDQIACLNKMRHHYRWPRLFMKFLVWAAYNAYIIIYSYRLHSHATHHTAVNRREARVQQSDLLHLQGVGQHHPKRSPAATGNNLCMVCCTNYNKYLKKHPATASKKCPTSGGKPHSGVPHATSISVSLLAAHAGVTITLKFSFGVEPSPE